MTAQTIDEAARMTRVPGIIFVDSATGGRVARIAGTGLEVWEIIWSLQSLCGDVNALYRQRNTIFAIHRDLAPVLMGCMF
jgi:hypothetical protein